MSYGLSGMSINRKIGFWALLPIVLSSQLGSGSFFIPSVIAKFGLFGLFSWFYTGLGSIILAIMFGILCVKFPQNGGPHVYIVEAFGKVVGFFSAWSYWVISWLSSCVLLFLVTGSLENIFNFSNFDEFLIQVSILLCITITNLFGVHTSSIQNTVLSFMKFFPIVLVCTLGWFYVDFENYVVKNNDCSGVLESFSGGAIATLWAFLGVESGTTPAGEVKDVKKDVFRALVIGQILVCMIYFVSCFVLYGVFGSELQNLPTPYVSLLNLIFNMSDNLAKWIPFLIVPVCVTSFNTWTIVSGQIALGASESNLFPRMFGIRNRYGAPYFAIIMSNLAQIPFLYVASDKVFLSRVTALADFSSSAFFVIYFVCVLAFIKIFRAKYLIVSLLSIMFCMWIFFVVGWKILLQVMVIPLTGVFLLVFKRKNMSFG
ncbi:APC family permease [Candidatus Gromoviella agglomerans]|uniref:APC family permease n=1 Tax=Candidatus Gromoviella agglomerans TaxID=2806609 RepID=UPI001E2F96B8|nr:amino acid permease [Candidatus Gromoviella agglomerans]UFX98344.1 Amino acid permease [Candidatus Gromoviella agglomerans]